MVKPLTASTDRDEDGKGSPPDPVSPIRRAKQRWLERVGDLPPASLGHGGDHGDTGEPLDALYVSEDVVFDELTDLGMPGEAPFVRGAYPKGYVVRPWFMTQYVGFATVEETNERWKALIGAGQKAVSLAFDLPSHLGYDSDDPLAEDEVGKAGVAIDSLDDFETLFDGIDLATIPATFNTAAIAPVVVAMYQVLGEKRGVAADQLMGTITNDSLSAAFRGTCVFPAESAVDLVVDVIEYCAEYMPKFTPINVQGVYMRSVGATKAQEAGYAMAFALEYLRAATRRGLDIDKIAPRFSFFFQCDSHFFEEAAKFRAARRTWAWLMESEFGTTKRESGLLRATGVSAARCFTKEEPEANLVRGAFSALGCALGGVQGMWISGFDEAFATPTEKASTLALRTMQILAEETGIRATIDPLGGGYYIEHLTNRMSEMMREHVREVDEHGGAVSASSSGYLRRRMLEYDLRWANERETGARPIVGHNVFVQERADTNEIEFQRFRPKVRDDQVARLDGVRSRRDDRAVRAALDEVRDAAAARRNVMPPIVAAVREYATIGEVMHELRAVHGEWKEPKI